MTSRPGITADLKEIPLGLDRPDLDPEDAGTAEYGGIGRLAYFLASIAIAAVTIGLNVAVHPLLGVATGLILTAVASAGRLRNLGMNAAWAYLSFVPVANWILWVRCQAFPEGYADTHELDTTARVIIGLALGSFVLIIGLVIVASMLSG